jgi:hypothetical protein
MSYDCLHERHFWPDGNSARRYQNYRSPIHAHQTRVLLWFRQCIRLVTSSCTSLPHPIFFLKITKQVCSTFKPSTSVYPLSNSVTDFHNVRQEYHVTGCNPKLVHFNFSQSVIAIWKRKFMKEWHYKLWSGSLSTTSSRRWRKGLQYGG